MIKLYTSATPNGQKISIMLEEMGVPYETHAISLSKGQQKEPWFLKINPNGRIPAIVDTDEEDLAVFESGAILIYLAEKYGRFLPKEIRPRADVLQWLMFQMGGIGPMQGQAGVFVKYAPEKIPYAIDRYKRETRRLYEILDDRLADREFLAGELSIADFATYPWLAAHWWSETSIEGLSHVGRWMKTLAERPGVVRGMAVPHPVALQTKEEQDTLIANARKLLV